MSTTQQVYIDTIGPYDFGDTLARLVSAELVHAAAAWQAIAQAIEAYNAGDPGKAEVIIRNADIPGAHDWSIQNAVFRSISRNGDKSNGGMG